MAQASILTDRPRRSIALDSMLKSDRPRTIDRYIDYFGGDTLPLRGHDTRDDVVAADIEEHTA